MKTRAELVAKNSPRQFMLDDPHEVRRLMVEAWGYLRTCHHKHGTDWEGRDFVMKALDELAKSPGAHLAVASVQPVKSLYGEHMSLTGDARDADTYLPASPEPRP